MAAHRRRGWQDEPLCHRDSGFSDHQDTRGETRRQRSTRSIHVCHVRSVLAKFLRWADTNEVDNFTARGRGVRRERESVGGGRIFDHLFQAGFVERRCAAPQQFDFCRVNIDADHLMPGLRHEAGLDEPR